MGNVKLMKSSKTRSVSVRKRNFDFVLAAGYVDPYRSAEVLENLDYRRYSDKEDVSMYETEFIAKPFVTRRLRPSSFYRRNKPPPRTAFHFAHPANQSIPVVRTKMTLEDLNKTRVTSPYRSSSHRTYRSYDQSEIHRAKSVKRQENMAAGIVPELHPSPKTAPAKVSDSLPDLLFPAIPNNSRLTSDLATKLTSSVVNVSRVARMFAARDRSKDNSEVYPFLPVKNLNKPALRPLHGIDNSMKVESWDGAPRVEAPTRSKVYGRKKEDPTKIDDAAGAVVPAVRAPSSKNLMFKEYTQYPKYAPQMLSDFYRGRNKSSAIKKRDV